MARGHHCAVDQEVYTDSCRPSSGRQASLLAAAGCATAHTAFRVREWLEGKFDDWVICCVTAPSPPAPRIWTNPGQLVLVGAPSGAAEEPLATLEGLITTVEECKDFLKE